MPEPKGQNVQRPTLNAQRPKDVTTNGHTYDLEERLLTYAADIIRVTESLSHTQSGNHVAAQLLRSDTSPLPNHGEAQAAEARHDFVHKMSICLKELRESRHWLRLIYRTPLTRDSKLVEALVLETKELIRIFAKSIKTARAKGIER